MPIVGDEPPFDLDGRETGSNEYVDSIFDEYGADDWAAFFVVGDDVPDDGLRPAMYLTPEEALIDIYERGIIGFTDIYYDAETDSYCIVVDYEE